jgi:hypothetical protein
VHDQPCKDVRANHEVECRKTGIKSPLAEMTVGRPQIAVMIIANSEKSLKIMKNDEVVTEGLRRLPERVSSGASRAWSHTCKFARNALAFGMRFPSRVDNVVWVPKILYGTDETPMTAEAPHHTCGPGCAGSLFTRDLDS